MNSAQYSPDGRRIVTASNGGSAEVWDAVDGHRLASLSGGDDKVLAAAFAPDGNRVVTAAANGAVRIWDVTRLMQPWDQLAPDTCHRLLTEQTRRFSEADITGDRLLTSQWRGAWRDVCARGGPLQQAVSLRPLVYRAPSAAGAVVGDPPSACRNEAGP